MKVARFLSLVACVAGFGFFDGTRVAEDAGAAGGDREGEPRPAPAPRPPGPDDDFLGRRSPAPTVSPAPTYSPTPVDPNETCESLIARGADLTCSACCPNECAEFDYTNADAYKTDAYTYFSTYTYDFRGHDGCVCFNDMNLNSEYGSVHLTEGNDCALVISNADIHGLGGDDTLMSFTSSNFFLFGGNNNIYGGAGDDHVKVLSGFEGYDDDYYAYWAATTVEGGDGEDSVVIYRGGAIVDGDVETVTFDAGGECAETGAESGARRCVHDYDY